MRRLLLLTTGEVLRITTNGFNSKYLFVNHTAKVAWIMNQDTWNYAGDTVTLRTSPLMLHGEPYIGIYPICMFEDITNE